jgi:polyphosphate kinase
MKRLFNRELSWLEFNDRVLSEALDSSLPLFERLKFTAIFASNLDEFFMVRVAAIKNQISMGYMEKDPSGYTPTEKLKAINDKVRHLVSRHEVILSELLDEMKEAGIHILDRESFDDPLLQKLELYFNTEVFPVLTPMAVDFTRRFPLVNNKGLYIAVKLLIGFDTKFAIVQVPSVLNRLVPIEKENGDPTYVMLEDVIDLFIDHLFLGHQVLATTYFRVTRNGDLNIVEDEAEDLLMVIEEAVRLRKWGETVRLEIKSGSDAWLMKVIQDALMLDAQQVYEVNGVLDATFLFKLKPPKGKKDLERKSYAPKKLESFDKKNLFKYIKNNDLFVHHPYESFEVVVDFIKQASKDPQVLAIKQTLYRVSGDSQIVKALGDAADRGKQVTVLVELMARFDEENNINWAKKLEQRGVHVIYGIYGLKTHSKITLVVRKEKNKIRRYLHLGTGNYNDQTAKVYTDMGIFTSRENFGADASVFFNMVSGFATSVNTHVLSVAPFNLRQKFYQLIDEEIKNSKDGKKAKINAKMNSLVDMEMIEKLYEASQAGVQIKLVVRGICTLVPGVKGLSENITVKSIVGEFLEHSRIYIFHNGGNKKVFLSSADWMSRNLNRRVELMFPVEDQTIANRIIKIMSLYLKDNVKSWYLNETGEYIKGDQNASDKIIHAQEILKTLDYIDSEEFSHNLSILM